MTLSSRTSLRWDGECWVAATLTPKGHVSRQSYHARLMDAAEWLAERTVGEETQGHATLTDALLGEIRARTESLVSLVSGSQGRSEGPERHPEPG